MILCLGQHDTCSVIRETVIIGMDWNHAMIFKYVSGYKLLISGEGCKTLGNGGKSLSLRASMFYTKQLRCIQKIVSVLPFHPAQLLSFSFGGLAWLDLCQKFAS